MPMLWILSSGKYFQYLRVAEIVLFGQRTRRRRETNTDLVKL